MCVSTLRLIRPASETPTQEVIKEFFYLVGCLFCDKPVQSLADADAELRKNTGVDIDIVLNPNAFCKGSLPQKSPDVLQRNKFTWQKGTEEASPIGQSGFIIRDDRRIFVTYELPGQDKMEFYRALIDKLIVHIWHSEREASQQKQLLKISQLYFETHLLGFLQSKRSLRILNMGETLGLSLEAQTIPAKGYIENMLLAFNQFYQETTTLQQNPEVSPYTLYANINIARKTREVFQLLGKEPPAVQSKDSGFQSVTYCSAAFLYTELGKLYRREPQYPGTLFLMARVCQSDPSQERNAGYYYQKLFKAITGKDQSAYSFIYYEYGHYIEKMEHNWSRAFRYYDRSAKLDPLSYRALFKCACHEAGNRNFTAARRYFKGVLQIIRTEFSGGETIIWENLSLSCIQYLFKTYMWMWKIFLSSNDYSGAQACLSNAWKAAEEYQKNECLRKVYDPESDIWKDLEGYHKNSRPVSLLREIVQSWADYTDMLMS